MGGAGPRDRWGDIYANAPVKKMIALYDYDPQELSPNVDAEVELVRLLWLQLLALVAVWFLIFTVFFIKYFMQISKLQFSKSCIRQKKQNDSLLCIFTVDKITSSVNKGL